jgi:hypothetical protein
MIVSPFIVLLAHSVIPFSRTFAYYNIFLSLMAAIVIVYVWKNLKLAHSIMLAIALQIILVFNFGRLIYKYEDFFIFYIE